MELLEERVSEMEKIIMKILYLQQDFQISISRLEKTTRKKRDRNKQTTRRDERV